MVSTSVARRPGRGAIVSAALLLIGGMVIGLVALQRDADDSTTGPTTPEVTTPKVTETTPATSSTTTSSSTSTTTTIVEPELSTIDLTDELPSLDPTKILSFPISPPGDLFATAFATTASGDRVVVLDDVTGVIRFVNGTTRKEIDQFDTDLPTVGSGNFIRGGILVGPADVLYVDQGGPGRPLLVAYGLDDDRYVEIARVRHLVGDGPVLLADEGVVVLGESEPLMRYVGNDGQPSGATLRVDPLDLVSELDDAYTVRRSGDAWKVQYKFPDDLGLPEAERCVLCAAAALGPDDSVVLVNHSPDRDGDLRLIITVLTDTIVTYDSEWTYIGAFGGKLLFDRLDEDSIDIATLEI